MPGWGNTRAMLAPLWHRRAPISIKESTEQPQDSTAPSERPVEDAQKADD